MGLFKKRKPVFRKVVRLRVTLVSVGQNSVVIELAGHGAGRNNDLAPMIATLNIDESITVEQPIESYLPD